MLMICILYQLKLHYLSLYQIHFTYVNDCNDMNRTSNIINMLIELKKRRINKQSHPVALCTIFILNNNAFSSAYNTSL